MLLDKFEEIKFLFILFLCFCLKFNFNSLIALDNKNKKLYSKGKRYILNFFTAKIFSYFKEIISFFKIVSIIFLSLISRLDGYKNLDLLKSKPFIDLPLAALPYQGNP